MTGGAAPSTDVEQREKQAEVAFTLQQQIIQGMSIAAVVWWKASEAMYEFHEMGGWGLLGYETLEEWLAQPDLSMSRSQFFRNVRAWRVLVVEQSIAPDQLESLQPSKVDEVLPAIRKGADIEDVLADVRTLGARDLRIKYGKEKELPPGEWPQNGQQGDAAGSSDGSPGDPTATTGEQGGTPEGRTAPLGICPTCGAVLPVEGAARVVAEHANAVDGGACWLGQFDTFQPACDYAGQPPHPHHLIRQQHLKGSLPTEAGGEGWEGELLILLADRRNIRMACAHHHRRWHDNRFEIPLSQVPAETVEFAAEHGLEAHLERDYKAAE